MHQNTTTVKHYQLKNNPALATILPEYPGNTYYKGRYISDESRVMPSWKTFFKWMFSFNEQRSEKRRDEYRLPLIKGNEFFHQTDNQLLWLGHATFLIRLQGTTIITDPCLRNLPFKKRKVGLPFKTEEITGLDFILLSHAHRDHLDLPTLKILVKNNPGVRILAGLGTSGLLPKAWHAQTEEAGWYQIFNNTGSLRIVYLPAQHWNRRFLFDLDQQLWGSFLIESDKTSIFFAGDTAFGQHFDKIRFLTKQIDHCIIPIGSYKPAFMMRGLHLNPKEAILAFKMLNGKNFIPMHYGTYDLSDEPLGEPLRMVAESKSRGSFSQNFRPLAVGERYAL